jgi:uncharacterized phage protein (TIGR02218 family)
MNFPVPPAPLVTSQGSVAWFQGVVSDITLTRHSAVLKVSSNLLVLTNTQMPRNLFQPGCVHTLYDNGCAILKSAFTATGTVSSVTSTSLFAISTTAAVGFYNLGVITFTSGANSGLSATVKTYANGNAIQVMTPFPATISPGDAYSIYPGCDRSQATCTSKFNNLEHFKGTPFIPVPETLYDGGTIQTATSPTAPAQQTGPIAKSSIAGNITPYINP